jgi:hypothetical protein
MAYRKALDRHGLVQHPPSFDTEAIMAGLDFGLGNLNPIKPGDFDFDLGFGGSHPRTRAAWRVPLPGEQEQSLSQKALGIGTSGLSHIAGLMDKPGQAVRGVLAGKGVRPLLNLLPFSDTLGITTDADHTSGRDLTDMVGLTDKHDKGWGAWGAGLAADLVTDPLSYLALGPKHALTAAGIAAKKVGVTKGLSRVAMMDDGYSGLAKIGIPFTQHQAVVGTGGAARKVAAGLDVAGDWAKYGNPVGRGFGALFDPAVGGAKDAITQRGWAKYGDPALQAEKVTGRAHEAGLLQKLDPLISAAPTREREYTNATLALAEGVPTVAGFSPDVVHAVQPAAHQIGIRNDEIIKQAKSLGLPVKEVSDRYANYVHRQAMSADAKGGLQLQNRTMFPVGSGSSVARDDVLRNVPGGTMRINDWYRRFAGDPNKAAVLGAVRHDLEQDLLAHAGGHTMTPVIAKQFDDKAVEMTERLAAADPKYRAIPGTQEGRDFFTPDLVGTEVQRGNQHARNTAAAKAVIGILRDNASQFKADGTMVSLPDVLKRIGLQTYKADKQAGTPIEGALRAMQEALAAQHGLASPDLMGRVKALRAQVGQFGVTNEHAQQILHAYNNKWAAPTPLKGPLDFLNGITNSFKALAYPIWIPAHVRNASTAAWNNAFHGVTPADHTMQSAIIKGTATPDQLAKYGLSSIDEARKLMYANGGIFSGHSVMGDVADSAATALPGQRFTQHAPGTGRENWLKDTALGIPQGLLQTGPAIARAAKEAVTNPKDWRGAIGRNIGISGVAGATVDTLPAVAAGRKVGTNVEDLFRGAQWLAEKRKGATPQAAADAVNRLHFDYDRLTDFEKNVMRKVVPFYTYARKNLPLQVENAIHNPLLVQAQIKPFNQPDTDKGYVPDYLQSGVSIPVGPEENGMRRYISKLGLPAEEAFERLHFRNGLPDLGRTAMDYMGQLNPVIKGPLEQLFDTQFHTQRKLSDLKAPQAASAIGRLFGDDNPQALAQFMANTPLTRFATSADKLLDDRKDWLTKAVNLGTGVRITDVNTDKQRAIDLNNAVRELMRGHEHISEYPSFYVKPEQAPNLTPEEVELMRLYSTLQQNARNFAKGQKIGVRQQ